MCIYFCLLRLLGVALTTRIFSSLPVTDHTANIGEELRKELTCPTSCEVLPPFIIYYTTKAGEEEPEMHNQVPRLLPNHLT